MALTTERLERVFGVASNVTNLCALINVADEQHYLQKCMSPESFEECMEGDTNMTRVQILCQKMVHEITAGNMYLFNALCAYFLDRSEAYKCMYQRFAVIGSSNSANGGSRSNDVQSELLSLQERVKELTEELQHLRESITTTDYQSELVAVREIFTENETASQSDESVLVYAVDVVANHPMEVEKLEPTVVAEQPLLREAQLSPCTIDNKPCLKAESVTSDTDVKPEEIQTADDVSALTGDDKENDNDDVLNVSEAANVVANHPMEVEKLEPTVVEEQPLLREAQLSPCTIDNKPVSCDWMKPDTDVKPCFHTESTNPDTDVNPEEDKENDYDNDDEVHNVTEDDATNETTNRGYLCEYCGKNFRMKSHFVDHVRTHTGEKPFACKDCNKMFTRNHDLLRHCLSHTGEKPFACKNCGKKFAEKHHFLQHCRIHTGEKPFACKECERRFSLNYNLLEHCRIHTGEKPFACTNCGKKFARKQHLLQHSRIHTGDRPYVCEHCEMAFRFKSSLHRHLLKKHSLATLKKRKPAHVGSSSLS